ncbi:MAG TPA: alanine racemase [Terriglobales bacterium]|nr:alanine racemase [Terriglobales bacterium]
MATTEIAKRAATRPTWAEVSLSALRENYKSVAEYVGTAVTVCAVVKAYAYGHGAVECASALEQEGATWLGVTSLDEAIPLREEGISTRILLMTGFWRGEEEEIIRLRLTPTVWEIGQIESLERAASRLGVSQHAIHLKVDTGMGRLGVAVHELPQVLKTLQSASHLRVEGFSTHIASSEVLDAPSVTEQLTAFDAARRVLRDHGFNPPLIHAANTSAVIAHHESWNTMVRPGLALYGYHLPFERAGRTVSGRGLKLNVKPVLTWKTRILSLRDMPPGQALGYGGTYVTKAPTRVAILPVGYADGLNRGLSSNGRVIVREHYAPIVGRISMDLTTVDVTGIPGVEVADEVILLGSQDGLSVDARQHAELAHTIPYEILCSISKRVPRKYIS